jgi:hypothetical protein
MAAIFGCFYVLVTADATTFNGQTLTTATSPFVGACFP